MFLPAYLTFSFRQIDQLPATYQLVGQQIGRATGSVRQFRFLSSRVAPQMVCKRCPFSNRYMGMRRGGIFLASFDRRAPRWFARRIWPCLALKSIFLLAAWLNKIALKNSRCHRTSVCLGDMFKTERFSSAVNLKRPDVERSQVRTRVRF